MNKKHIPFLLTLIACIIFTYGLTRWYTTSTIVRNNNKIINEVYSESAKASGKVILFPKEVSIIRKKMGLSYGIYYWQTGLIICTFLSLGLLLIGLYIAKNRTKTASELKAEKTD